MSRFPCALNTLSLVQPRGVLGSSYKSTYALYRVCEAHVECMACSECLDTVVCEVVTRCITLHGHFRNT
jgi:hypothetical protein